MAETGTATWAVTAPWLQTAAEAGSAAVGVAPAGRLLHSC